MFFGGQRSGLRTFVEWVFYIYIALFPYILYRGYLFNGTSTRSVNFFFLIEVLVIIFAFALFSKKKDLSVVKSPISLALLVYLVILFASAISGVDFISSFWSKATRTTGLFYFTHLALLYMFLLMIFKEGQVWRRFIKVMIISSSIFSILMFLGPEGINIILKSSPWDALTFGNSTFAAMYLFAAFMLSIYYFLTRESKNRWWHYLIPVSIIINPHFISRDFWYGKINIFKEPLLLIGEARATTYATIVAIFSLVVIWFISKVKDSGIRKKIILFASIVGIILAIVAVRSFLTPGGNLNESYMQQSGGARPIVWRLSSDAISDRPILGWGIDNFERAFETYYDNTLLESRNGGEAWFDRAHNIFIDLAVDTGYIGLVGYILVYLVIFASLVYVLIKSKKRNVQIGAIVAIVYFAGHLMELQTAFDTSISYIPLTIMAVFASILFYQTREEIGKKILWLTPKWVQYSFALVLLGYFGWALFAGTIPIANAEYSNGRIRLVGNSEGRLARYDSLFGSPIDKASFLWRTTTDFQRGIAENPNVLKNPRNVENFKKELAVFAQEYREYIEKHPTDYRAMLNLADIYLYEGLFGIDHLKEAHEVLDRAVPLVPQAPQAYWMKSVAYLYQREFVLAREWAKKSLDLNPGIEESQRLMTYIEKSIKEFPEIDLYFFSKI